MKNALVVEVSFNGADAAHKESGRGLKVCLNETPYVPLNNVDLYSILKFSNVGQHCLSMDARS